MRIDGQGGTAALISGLVRELPQHLETDDQAAGAQIGAAVLDLLHVGLAAQLDRTSAVGPGPGAARCAPDAVRSSRPA